MKKIILYTVYLLSLSTAYAQDHNTCDSTYLHNAAHIQTSDPCLLIATDYILQHSLYENSKLYYNYVSFITGWMDKTPDFTFSLNDQILSLCKDDNLSLFNVYLTCLAKAAIELKKDYTPAALKLFVAYVENPGNKVKRTSKLKRLITDVHKNRMDKYI